MNIRTDRTETAKDEPTPFPGGTPAQTYLSMSREYPSSPLPGTIEHAATVVEQLSDPLGPAYQHPADADDQCDCDGECSS